MNTTKQLLCVGGLLLAGAVAQAQGDPDLIDVTSLEQLNAIRYDLNGDGIADDPANATAYETAFPSLPLHRHEGYELTTNLDFEDAASYAASDRNDAWVDPTNGGTTDTEGWEPIGDGNIIDRGSAFFNPSLNVFSAIFEGNDNTISNLYINSSGTVGGLFGYIGGYAEIRNLALKEVSVTVTGSAYAFAGGLVGTGGTISGCSVTGNATATAYAYASAGGLVGTGGTISGCYATGNATATATTGAAYAGGLVGTGGTISGCYATGNATATATTGAAYAGGLVGPGGSISACYATGNADANGDSYAYAGGLVGESYGTISDCYATGNADAIATATTGDAYAGGLVGALGNNYIRGIFEGSVSACYATGSADANGNSSAYAGGLVGALGDTRGIFRGSVSACYATGNAEANATTGNAYAGGLVGIGGTISGCYATGNAEANATTGNAFAGGFIGRNLNTGNITACYSIGEATATGNTTDVGGFEGFNVGRISKSYFDYETSNRPDADIGAQTTSDLQSPTDYTGIYQDWNITSTTEDEAEFVLWALCEGAEYPKLTADFDGNGTPSVDEFGPQGSCSLPPGTPDAPPTTVPTSPDPPTTVPDPSTIEGRVTALETRHDTEITDLETRHNTEIAALEASQATQDTEIEALKAKIAAFEAATGGQSTTIYNVPGVSASARVYPNPAKHSLLFANLTPGRVYLYKIYTSSGVLLRSDAVQSDEAIDISTFEAGQHLLVLQDDASREVLRSSLLIE